MKGGISSLREAVGLLTVIPVCPRTGTVRVSSGEMCHAMGWFPLVGAGVGGVTGLVFLWASRFWPAPAAAAWALTAWVAVTGALHLDGFADTLDGFASRSGREETLRIMQDSRIGAVGAVGLVLLLLLKWSFLLVIPPQRVLGAWVAACALSRMSMVASAQLFPYAPGKSGMGRLVTDHRSGRILGWSGALAIALTLASVGPVRTCLLVGVAGLLVWGWNRLCLRRLGGVTGDTLGAINEWVEASLLGILSAC